MRVLLLVVACVWVALGASAEPVELHYYYTRGCPDCEVMGQVVETLAEEFPELRIVKIHVGYDSASWRRMTAMADAFGVKGRHVPMVFVGEVGVAGFDRTVEMLLYEEIERCMQVGCPPPSERIEGRIPWRPSPIEILLATVVLLGLLAVFASPSSP